MITKYTCIGKGKTDANGVAQLTHDCQGNVLQTPGYTGQGKGKLNIIASTDGPSVIDSGSVVSQPYEVTDCLYYDKALSGTGNYNDAMWNLNNATITRGANGSTIKSTAQWGSIGVGTTSSRQALPLTDTILCIEYNATGMDTHTFFNFKYNDGTNHYLYAPILDGHHKLYISNSRQLFLVDDVVKNEFSLNWASSSVYFQSSADAVDLEFTFANFKIYPVGAFPSI